MKAAYQLAILLALFSSSARADCFDDAARYHGVNVWVLRAIATQESSLRPNAINQNSNGTVDSGLMGINSVHLEELAKYGVGSGDLKQGCKSIYIGAWHYKKKVKKFGDTCKAIGAYHSETPAFRDIYIEAIRKVLLEKWRIPLNC